MTDLKRDGSVGYWLYIFFFLFCVVGSEEDLSLNVGRIAGAGS